MSDYVAKLFVDGELEDFTAMQMAYFINLYEGWLKSVENLTETGFNNGLQKYHPNKKRWAPIAKSLSDRGFIERVTINYDIYSSDDLRLGEEQGCVIYKQKLKRLFEYEYNIKNICKFKDVFELIVKSDTYSDEDYRNMVYVIDTYNSNLTRINKSVIFHKADKYYIDTLIKGLRKNTWYRK